MMTDKTLDDLKVDAHNAVLHPKVDSLIEKQKELTARVRANEKDRKSEVSMIVILLIHHIISFFIINVP